MQQAIYQKDWKKSFAYHQPYPTPKWSLSKFIIDCIAMAGIVMFAVLTTLIVGL